tara:strand:+ start:1388 stop:1798 length:411 start_codon:yes stop_codon:yes gene_type:complete
MAALSQDTRLVMTILFVGTVSGANVYFYSAYGLNFPYGALAHSVLFGLITVGGIMVMKALFDLSLNDKIEIRLLDRQIENHFQRLQREEQIKSKLQDSMKQFGTVRRENWRNGVMATTEDYDDNTIGNEFLATIQQ